MGGMHHFLATKVPYVDGHISFAFVVEGTRPVLDLDALRGLFRRLEFLPCKGLDQRRLSHPALAYQDQLGFVQRPALAEDIFEDLFGRLGLFTIDNLIPCWT